MIKAKPLSVNECWQGRRYKTPKYQAYEQEIYYQLPDLKIPHGNLKLELTFGVSNKASDADNLVKPFQDILQKRYNFNDKLIYRLEITKEIVKKGQEYIKFNITKYENRLARENKQGD